MPMAEFREYYRPDRCRRRVHASAAEPRVRAPFDSTCAGLV